MPVILKTLAAPSPNAVSISRLHNEFNLLQANRVTGLAEAIALENDGRQFAIVMGDAGKKTLRNLIEEGPLDIDSFLRFALAIAINMERLHKNHTIHCDISPDNVVIDEERNAVTIVDFDMATQTKSCLNLVRPNRLLSRQDV